MWRSAPIDVIVSGTAFAFDALSFAFASLLADVNAELLFVTAGALVLGAAVMAGAREPVRSID